MKQMTKIAAMVLFMMSTQYSQAQKVYATKTGQIAFNASSPIEKIAAINNQTDSKFVGENGQVVFAVLIKGFKFENQLMEDHFNENYMESTKFPKADFKGYITNIKEVNFSKDGSYPVNLDGNLTLHGVTNKVTATGTMKVAGGAPEMEGTFKIKLKDYKVEGLYIGEKIAPEVAITVKCKYQ
ncbi:MAG: YceI family protein [Bacteroidota bacterium]